jgi:hypothetical protein
MFKKYWLVNELCPVALTHTFFVHLGIDLILVLGFYSGLSGRVRTVYLLSLCVVLLLFSRFTASALVWFSDFLKYFVLHFFISQSTVFICRSSWILWLFMYHGTYLRIRLLRWAEISMVDHYHCLQECTVYTFRVEEMNAFLFFTIAVTTDCLQSWISFCWNGIRRGYISSNLCPCRNI